MHPLVRYAVMALAPAAAFLAAQRALEAVSSYSAPARPRAAPDRDEAAALVRRLRAEYDDLRAHRPAAKAHRLRAAGLALADAQEALRRLDEGDAAWGTRAAQN